MKLPQLNMSALKKIQTSPAFRGSTPAFKPQQNSSPVQGNLLSPRCGGYAGAPGGKLNKIC